MESESSNSAHNAVERKKSNLAFAFFCMDKDRARDMEIFYAFCRLMDDIADDENTGDAEKKKSLGLWRAEIEKAYGGDEKISPLGEEMRGLVRRRNVPKEHVLEIIDGVERDTDPAPFETFEDIRKYCHGVASAVGLVSIRVFGCKSPLAEEFAESLGYALQFTNILRDVVDDIKTRGRVYIPSRELEAFGVSRADLLENPHSPKCKKLYRFLYFRAKRFFNKSRRLLPPEDKRALAPALIMWAIYEEILESLARLDFEIPEKPLKISKPKKIALALRAIRESKKTSPRLRHGKAAVLGAGIAGISAAVKLAREGFDVSLYEARAQIGGRCASIEWHGARLDAATHAAMGCYKNFFSLFESLGAEIPEFFDRAKSMQFAFPGGARQTAAYPGENAGALKKLLAFFSYAKIDGARDAMPLLLKIKLGLANARSGETAESYLARMGAAAKSVKNFWEPFCVSALNTPLEKTDASLMLKTARKSILKGGSEGVLHLPNRPIADALGRAKIYLEGVGAKIFAGVGVSKIVFQNGSAAGIETAESGFVPYDFVVSALPARSLKKLLPENSELAKQLGGIAETNVSNIYFKSPRKLADGEYACLVGSPLHWIFPRGKAADGQYIYGITVSASADALSKDGARKLLDGELEKFFGKTEISDVLPSTFFGATISADPQTEAARPLAADAAREFSNFRICGDWVQTELPCTMESAAKSAADLSL